LTIRASVLSLTLLLTISISLSSANESNIIHSKFSREEVWKEFHEVRYKQFGRFQEIQVYAESSDLSRICYIADKQIFMYKHKDKIKEGISHIEPVQHAKLIPNIDLVNRITFKETERSQYGVFQIWYYETLELSIGGF